jgi:hypothetical protein
MATYGDLREWLCYTMTHHSQLSTLTINPVTEMTGTLSITVNGNLFTSPVSTLERCKRVKRNCRKPVFYI